MRPDNSGVAGLLPSTAWEARRPTGATLVGLALSVSGAMPSMGLVDPQFCYISYQAIPQVSYQARFRLFYYGLL